MKHLFLSTLLLVPGSLILTGCGGGGVVRSTHPVARATISVSLNPGALARLAQRAQLSPKSANSGRLIPTNSVTLHILYTQVDAGNNLAARDLVVSPVPAANLGGTYTTTLTDIAAGIDNTITVTLVDNSAVTIADGSTKVNLTPGSLAANNQINVTLQSLVLNPIQVRMDNGAAVAINDSVSHSLAATIASSNLGASAPVTTILPAQLNWTVDHPERLQLLGTTGYSIAVRSLQPGPVVVTLTYTEPQTVNGQQVNVTVATGTINLQLNMVLNADSIKSVQDGSAPTPGNVPASALLDLTDNGYLLFYDVNQTVTSVDTSSGYARIAQYLYGQPIPASGADLVDFDTASAPTYVGGASHMATFKKTGTSYWAVVSGDGTYLNALPAGSSRYSDKTTAPTGSAWTAPYHPAASIVDLTSDGTNLYLLEVQGGNYQIDTVSGSSGSSMGTLALGNLGFSPISLATIATTDGLGHAEIDYYLAGSGKIAQLKTVPLLGTQTLNTSFGALAGVVQIATSATDSRYVAAISASKLALFSTQNGTQIPLGIAPSTVSAQSLSHTGLRLGYSGRNLYVLENDGATPVPNGQLESFQIP